MSMWMILRDGGASFTPRSLTTLRLGGEGARCLCIPRNICLWAAQTPPKPGTQQDSPMNIHEYQAKELLAKFGVPVPAGHAAMSVEDAVRAAKLLPGPLWVVKAQIHAGGRGKGKFKELGPDAKGGVRLAKSIDEVRAHAEEMLGKTLVTVQTGAEGKQVQRLYITDGVDIEKEFYLALLVDRATGRIAIVASTEGGMDFEQVAHDAPEKIETITIDPATGLMPHHGRAVAAALGLSGDLAKPVSYTH